MALEYKLPYTASEINRKLAMVDETKNSLENDYYTSTEIDTKIDEVNTSIEEINSNVDTKIGEATATLEENISANINTSLDTKLATKADLIDGKIPASQLPDNIGAGGGASEVDWETDIINKPFYDTRVMSYYSAAENPNPVSFDCAPINYSFYKISDLVLTREEILGTKIMVHNRVLKPKEEYILVETNEFISLDINNGNYSYGFMFTNTAGTLNFTFSGYPLSVDVPETGIYYIRPLGQSMTSNTNIEILVSGELKPLDPKYLPQGGVGYETKVFEDIIWDGNTDGLPSVSQELNAGSEGTYVFSAYKVSNEYISEKDIIGATVTSSDGDLGTLTEDNIDMMDTGSYSVSRHGMFCSIKQPNDSVLVSQIGLTFTLPERGVWFITMSVGGQIYLYGALSLVSTTELKKIDPKFVDALPQVSTSDDGKFLCVENGQWTPKTMSEWTGGSY